jgi:hypothetical protein
MERAKSGLAWDATESWRACFVGGAAHWQGEGGAAVELEANTLLLNLPPGPCRLVAQNSEPIFWIAADLEEEGA